MTSTHPGGPDPGRGRSPRARALTVVYAVAFAVLLGSGAFLLLTRGGGAAETPTTDPGPSTSAAGLRTERLTGARALAGPSYGLENYQATKDKNQSKLWYAGGSWWGVLLHEASLTTRIFRWDEGRWRDTGVVVDRRLRSYADVEWTGRELFIASRVSGGTSYLTRYRLQDGTSWVSVTAFPRTIARGGSSSLSMAVDSLERVWVVFNRDGRIWVTNSSPRGGPFGSERPVPGRSSVRDDDTAAVIAVDDKIAVMWSDQVAGAFRFAIRDDSAPLDVLELRGAPVRGVRIADGHVHLVAMRDGRLVAAVKTSLGDADRDPPRSPLLVLLVRAPGGGWTRHTVATTADKMTRPQIVLSADERTIYLVAAAPQSGGQIYLKLASTRSWSFAPGVGTRILGSDADKINNPTTVRSRLSKGSGLLVLASDSRQARYFTADIPVDGR